METVLEELEKAGLKVEFLGEQGGLMFLKINQYKLPENCVEEAADIVLPLPNVFPQVPPYGFHAMTSISPKKGTYKNTNPQQHPLLGHNVFFSRKADGSWNSIHGDIFIFLGFVNGWLKNAN